MSVVISLTDRKKRYLADHPEPYSGAWLKAVARRSCPESGNRPAREEFLNDLPSLLDEVLELGMHGIDYGSMKNTDIAMALRGLALVAVSLERATDAAGAATGAAIDVQSLQAAKTMSRMLEERRSAFFNAIREVKKATALLDETFGAIYSVMMDLPLHVGNITAGK